MKLSDLLARVRSKARQLSPAVRAETAYSLGRDRLITGASARALAGEPWMDEGRPFGRGFDERVIEYPWVYAHLGSGERLLDVGSALNHADHIERIAAGGARVVFLNPYRDEGFRSGSPAARYARADARAPAIRPGSFRRVTCISTLEHMGCDNTLYGGPARASADAPARAREAAMRAMRELLAPGGALLLTVPFGRAEDHGWFVQLDAAMLAEATRAFGSGAVSATYFLHEAEGWRVVTPERCAQARYGERTRGATAVACLELRA